MIRNSIQFLNSMWLHKFLENYGNGHYYRDALY